MKKICSFLMSALCAANVFADYNAGDVVGTELPTDKLIKIGTAQGEMIPGQWYFLHSPRNPNTNAEAFAEVGGTITATGGLVTDKGLGSAVLLTATTAIEELTAEEGASAKNYTANMVRFVAVDGEEGAYNIQFGTGNWLADAPGSGTVNNNIAGNAGKYNFYLVTIGGEANTAGRFGWNKYNMQQRVDNNGAGNGVVFWSEGETTGESEGWTVSEEIMGNKIWQIYNIEVVGTLDKFDEAWGALLDDYNTISNMSEGAFIDNMRNGVNVGTQPGNYLAEYVNAFLTIWDEVDELMYEIKMNGMDVLYEKFETVEDLEAYNKALVDAYNAIINNKIPLATSNIAPGYYTINSCLYWYTTKQDTIFYTQEEADSVNAESGYIDGDEGYVTLGDVKEVVSKQVAAPKKALYSRHDDGTNADWAAWGTQVARADFLWKIETVEGKPTEYRLINMDNGKTHISIGQSSNSRLELNETATVCFDWRNDAEAVTYADAEGNEVTDIVVSYNIRSSKQAESSYNYLHCGGHYSGAGTGSWIVGWADGVATRWYLTPVDETTANEWITGPAAQVKAKVLQGNKIAAAFPAQLKIAKDLVANLFTETPVANAENFSSPYHCPKEGSIEALFDGVTENLDNFWHSNWEFGNDYAYSTTNGTNYFVVNDANDKIDGGLAIVVARRPAYNDHLTQMIVYGTNDSYDAAADLQSVKNTGKGTCNWTELGMLELPYSNNTETVTSNAITFNGKYKYYKFVATATTNNRGYFHMAEFQLYPATTITRYATSQYNVRKTEADALAAAVDAWNQGNYDMDDGSLLEDEGFNAAYNSLIAASEAWNAVYVNPTELREAIANAPSKDLFVIGNNPGQWKSVPTFVTVLAQAQAYDESGAYDAAKSQAHIDAIANIDLNEVYDQANGVETSKWYRIKFPTEQMYETYGWSKVSAQAIEANGHTQSPALFSKKVAVVDKKVEYVTYTNENSEEFEMDTYSVKVAQKAYDGHTLGYVNEACENGEDMFRFISVGDSKYMMQNKATGLFVRSGYPVSLSAIPSYFTIKAIGAGACLIAGESVTGNGEGHAYLHAQRGDNTFTTWYSTELGSNSMMMLEEVETVTAEPTTEYSAKLWPGKFNAITMPVDVSIVSGAKAYAAEVVESEGTHTVKLTDLGKDISAGTPFILIADLVGEYVSVGDYTAQVEAQLKEELEVEWLQNNNWIEVNNRVNAKYTEVRLNHGMNVNATASSHFALQGTMAPMDVAAGKALVANENGFSYVKSNDWIEAYNAYIAHDFDPESVDTIYTVIGNQELRTFELTVSSVGYATMYLDYAVNIPQGVGVYVASTVEEDRIKMTELNGIIPANTGVIVKAKAGTYRFLEGSASTPRVAENLLRGTVTRQQISTDSNSSYYVLSAPGGEVGMYTVALDANGKFWNNANKAYMVVGFSIGLDDSGVEPESQLSRRLVFDFGDETGIDEVETENAGTAVYDLSGRRVQKAQKGIYIQNNKKVLVK